MTNNNFFELFQQPVSFDIDLVMLAEKLHTLQKQYHPDNANSNVNNNANVNNNTSSNLETQTTQTIQSAETAHSALINHAYNTLKNPDSRAMHLLELSNQIVNFDNSIADLDFLDDAMDIRIAFIDEQSKRFKQAYQSIVEQSQNQQNTIQTAIDATQKLKFLVKIDKDIDTAIDDIARNQFFKTINP
ncbi:MAG: Fe-S protein assembly co-chaperone HscB [Pseudomonadales bacterium]|nr:MAG: Fe-S protein assembly co-chaperone HscB [Pseudomonadales bacterium]